MGILEDALAHPVAQEFLALGLGYQIAIGFSAFITLAIFLNVASQILFKNPNEPPMVFHLLPFIGSTVIYGMDPPTFFRKNRAKVRRLVQMA
jgi:sterol 14alpha-demethylase